MEINFDKIKFVDVFETKFVSPTKYLRVNDNDITRLQLHKECQKSNKLFITRNTKNTPSLLESNRKTLRTQSFTINSTETASPVKLGRKNSNSKVSEFKILSERPSKSKINRNIFVKKLDDHHDNSMSPQKSFRIKNIKSAQLQPSIVSESTINDGMYSNREINIDKFNKYVNVDHSSNK
jgi:hypothetical protein